MTLFAIIIIICVYKDQHYHEMVQCLLSGNHFTSYFRILLNFRLYYTKPVDQFQ